MNGRVFIEHNGQNIVAEINKFTGSPIEIALEPGRYQVTLVNDDKRFSEQVFALSPGEHRQLDAENFTEFEPTLARSRGGEALDEEIGEVTDEQDNEVTDKTEELLSRLRKWRNQFDQKPPVNSDGTTTKFAFSLLHSSVSGDLRGLNIGLVGSQIEGGLYGVSFSTFYDIAGLGVSGLQLSSIMNMNYGFVNGVQLAGLFNIAKRDVKGVQLSSLFNIAASTVSGVQIAGLFNIADKQMNGVQLGVMNIVSGTVNGLQLGLINISEDMNGIPIGLINVVLNGIHEISLWMEHTSSAFVGLVNGGRVFYTIIYTGAGLRLGDPSWLQNLVFGIGLGARISFNPIPVYIDLELSARRGTMGNNVADRLSSTFDTENVYFYPTSRILLGVEILDIMRLFVGLSTDWAINNSNELMDQYGGFGMGAVEFPGFGTLYNRFTFGVSLDPF